MEFKSTNIKYIQIDWLKHHPDNPRKDLGDLSELSDSIKKNGVFQNLTVVPSDENDGTYYVVIGNRRMEASKIAGLKELPCVISDMNRQEQVVTMLAENMQRNDLSVYEQGWGFQLAMDLGETVESIAEKSGFSKSTVKRRVKLAELDQERLKKVSERQISISDLDVLSKIEDIETRNTLLLEIGTPNFQYRIKNAIKDQDRIKKEKKWEAFFTELGLKKILYNEVHSGKYGVPKQNYFALDSVGINDFSLNGDEKYFSINYGTAYFRRDISSQEKKQTLRDEMQRREASYRVERLNQVRETAYELRKQFVFSVTESEARKKLTKIIEMVMLPDWDRTFERAYYCRYEPSKFFANEDSLPEGSTTFDTVCDRVKSNPCQALLRHAYVASGDGERIGSHNWQGCHFPNDRLNKIYDFLIELGYEPAEEEIKYKDGSHRLFMEQTKED